MVINIFWQGLSFSKFTLNVGKVCHVLLKSCKKCCKMWFYNTKSFQVMFFRQQSAVWYHFSNSEHFLWAKMMTNLASSCDLKWRARHNSQWLEWVNAGTTMYSTRPNALPTVSNPLTHIRWEYVVWWDIFAFGLSPRRCVYTLARPRASLSWLAPSALLPWLVKKKSVASLTKTNLRNNHQI